MKALPVLVAVAAATLASACSPRFGYQPDDELNVPFRISRDVFDNRFDGPHQTLVPRTLPPGVYQKAPRPDLPPPAPQTSDTAADAAWRN